MDGKRKNLQNRKFCLLCSPWGRHNTKSDDPAKPSKRSRKNGKLVPYAQWSEESKNKCRKRVWESGYKRKQKLIDLKGGKCIKCGYNRCIRALSFHHKNPLKKQFGLDMRNIRGLSWSTVLSEVDKCDLYCLNCHMEIESKIAKKTGKYHND